MKQCARSMYAHIFEEAPASYLRQTDTNGTLIKHRSPNIFTNTEDMNDNTTPQRIMTVTVNFVTIQASL